MSIVIEPAEAPDTDVDDERPRRRLRAKDPELRVMEDVLEQFEPFDRETRERMWSWIGARLGIGTTEMVG